MGKGSKAPVEQTITQTNIPKEFMPYFERLMGRVEEQSLQDYTPYGGQRLATADQFGDIAASQEATRALAAAGTPLLTEAQGMTRNVAQGAAGLAALQQPYQFSQYGGFQAGQATPYAGFTAGSANPFMDFTVTKGTEFKDFNAGRATPFADFSAVEAQPFSDFSEAGYNEFQFGPAGEFSGDAISRYMDPYVQNVVRLEKERALEDYDIARGARSARAVQAGAFGGSRAAVQESMAERDLLERQEGIQARGLSAAYSDAQKLFEADRAARMSQQQAQAGEAARVQSGVAGEAARVQAARAAELARVQGMTQEEAARVQGARAAELARTQGINIDEQARVQQARAAEAARMQQMSQEEFARVQQAQAAELARVQGISLDEAARVQQAQAAELARVQGIGIDEAARIQAGQAAELARVQGAQAGENLAANQFGLEALRLQGQQAGQLAGLSEQERAAQIQNAQMLEAIGRAQQGEAQAQLDIDYQDFLRQQGFPQEQLAFYSDILRGLPVANAGTSTETTSVYTNPLQQALGAGLSGLSLYRAFQ